MINFNEPIMVEKGFDYIKDAITNHKKLSGDGIYTKKCHQWMEERFNVNKVLLTTSCTHALEMSALLANIQEGDEVIAPSYTFVSTVNAFVLRGAKIVFVDIRPDTMNLDENLIEAAITSKTKAIIVVHYAGVACEMDTIQSIAKRHHLFLIEDAAQGVMSTYKGKALGTLGDFGTYSFHETKNYIMGEGGALLINTKEHIDRAEIIREKGTDRSQYFRGQVDKYSWRDLGSSYLPSELNAAYLYAQLEIADEINKVRHAIWNQYNVSLQDLKLKKKIELPFIPTECTHNAHMYYIKCRDLQERTELTQFLLKHGIQAVFHYVPLHSAQAGKQFGRFHGEDIYTTKESERLLRLPFFYGLMTQDVSMICDRIHEFYQSK